MVVVRKLLQNVLPALLLLELVDARGDQGYKAAPPHARATGDNGCGEGGAGVVDELARGVEGLAAVAEEAGGVGLGVEIEEEGTKDHRQTAMKDIETVLQFNCRTQENSSACVAVQSVCVCGGGGVFYNIHVHVHVHLVLHDIYWVGYEHMSGP